MLKPVPTHLVSRWQPNRICLGKHVYVGVGKPPIRVKVPIHGGQVAQLSQLTLKVGGVLTGGGQEEKVLFNWPRSVLRV